MSAVPAVIERTEQALVTPRTPFNFLDLVMNPEAMRSVMQLAEFMAKGVATIPSHLRGKPSDCLAIILQAFRWGGMDPSALALKTYFVSDKIAYEGQAINAAIITCAPIKYRPRYRYFGDWTKVIGKFEIRKNDKGQEYRVPGWKLADEEGLGIVFETTLIGEDEPRELELLLAQARTRNSTLWADDPKQQLGYLAARRWARLHVPDVILGVYTPDELEEARERDMGHAEIVTPQGGSRTDQVKARLSVGSSAVAKKEQPAAPTLEEVRQALAAAMTLEAVTKVQPLAAKLPQADVPAAQELFKERRAAIKATLKSKATAETVDPSTGEITGSAAATDASAEPFLLAHFVDGARTAAAGGREALLDYSAGYLAQLPKEQRGEADEAVQQLLRGLPAEN